MKFIIGANLKMNKKKANLEEYCSFLQKSYLKGKNSELIIFPPFPYLSLIHEKLKDSSINLGAQNAYFEEKGEFTGEVSVSMLDDFDCKYLIIGHSERRKYFDENNILINNKILSAMQQNIRPILCIGENLQQKSEGLTEKILKKQINEGLVGVSDYSKIDIAYEPIWAIGTGEAASRDYVEKIHNFIRKYLGNEETRILYGGSVKPENSEILSNIKNVNGFLVGGASLDPNKIIEINNNLSI